MSSSQLQLWLIQGHVKDPQVVRGKRSRHVAFALTSEDVDDRPEALMDAVYACRSAGIDHVSFYDASASCRRIFTIPTIQKVQVLSSPILSEPPEPNEMRTAVNRFSHPCQALQRFCRWVVSRLRAKFALASNLDHRFLPDGETIVSVCSATPLWQATVRDHGLYVHHVFPFNGLAGTRNRYTQLEHCSESLLAPWRGPVWPTPVFPGLVRWFEARVGNYHGS